MARIEVTKTELVWPGKYQEDGSLTAVPRVSLPFQVIESVNESRATRESRKTRTFSLFDAYEGDPGDSFEDGWRNKLIWGDNLLVMGSLLERFAGKVDLIYIDPPFATGADFSFTAQIGDDSSLESTKQQSLIEEKAYRDTWGRGDGSYLGMLFPRLHLMRDLLGADGVLFVHCDWRVNSMVRVMLDEVFGRDCFRNEIIWRRAPNLGRQAAAKQLGRVIDTILAYTKSPGALFRGDTPYRSKEVPLGRNGRPEGARWDDRRGLFFTLAPRGDYTDESIAKLDAEGRVYRAEGGQVYIMYFLRKGEDGKWYKDQPVDTLWDDYDVRPLRHCTRDELDIGYDTQKPQGLLQRIVSWATPPNALVADFFCGSGTTLAVAEQLGRRWIGCDLSRWAMHVTRKRLLGLEGCHPFEILNLGKYERQHWQSVSFGDEGGAGMEQAVVSYLAFVLKLYGAQPLPGTEHLHGTRGGAVVHVGAVDAPVTIDEIMASVKEAAALRQQELHVLGWEWEMGLHDLVTAEAKRDGVKLALLQIPLEIMEQQAVDKGDVRFFELAYLAAEVCQGKDPRTITVRLTDFCIPNADLIPENVRDRISKWSDYIDYWAVDWSFQNDTFVQGWVTYRTRRDRSLPLESDEHTYDEPGAYRILVKVIDVFGNDTTQAVDVEVR